MGRVKRYLEEMHEDMQNGSTKLENYNEYWQQQYWYWMFGEEFMDSQDKGTLKEYDV